jgi:hypothetical protein
MDKYFCELAKVNEGQRPSKDKHAVLLNICEKKILTTIAFCRGWFIQHIVERCYKIGEK